MADNARDAKAFYDSRPWLQAYGEGIPHELPRPDHQSVAELIRSASRQHRDRIAYTLCLDNGMHASLRYSEVDRLSDCFAAYLREELGLQPGERVAVQMPNCLSYPVAVAGILKAGLVVVNVNPLYTASEMKGQLRDSGASTLLLIDLFADKLQDGLDGTMVKHVLLAGIAEFFPLPRKLIIRAALTLKKQLPKPNRPCTRFADALRVGQRHLDRNPAAARADAGDHRQLAVLQYTGGTTGIPKGAMLSHGNLLWNLDQIQAVAGPVIRSGQDVVLTALPLYHIFAFTFNMLCFYRNGCRNILCPTPRPPSKLRKAFEQFDVTKFSGVNVLFHALTREDWFRDNTPPVDMSIAGGTALHAPVAEAWEALVGSPLCEGYGLSETSPVVAVNQPTGRILLGSIGLPVPGTDVRMVDDNDVPVPCGQPGELTVRGPQVFSGYWNRETESADALRDGWFHTGDIAIMDERGFIHIVDRKKDMIDVKGFNVYPNEVEEVLGTHPDVVEAAVIGLPCGEAGESVIAYVVSSNLALTAEDVLAFVRDRLTGYKCPQRIVFREELPKSPVGKILRKELRREAIAEAESATT